MKLKFITTIMAIIALFFLNSCVDGKLPGADARKFPPNPDERVKKNIEEGRGFRLMEAFDTKGSGNFEFASSNELWRATLDTIDFMPLALANYSGGIIVTDWYSDGSNINESIKISVRFLTNEVRSDALDIKVFYKKCSSIENCAISEQGGILVTELTKKILSRAAVYMKQNKDKSYQPYEGKIRPKSDE
tara:strand:- start:157 stop:726 length:570 start_codon:yes stop_codon:yes gene_type:complete